jgi:hypothetical protein
MGARDRRDRFASGPIRFSKPQTSHGERTFPAAIFRLCRAYRAARSAKTKDSHPRNDQHVDFGLFVVRADLGFFYIVLFEFQPNAFSFGGAPTSSELQITPILIYFSLTTIATVGYGDIAPLTLQARYAAVAEGIAGQFYLAILVARLVGMQMSAEWRFCRATERV